MIGTQIVKVAEPFRLVRNRDVYRVIDDRTGDTVKETCSPSTGHYALDRAVRQDALKAGQNDRPCMCCQAVFRSDGPHNRMCNTCRQKTGGMD